ncbi:histidine phosphatase family protein [Gordoniibacillus kamchatkensis]|uniref:histidine phosphatase family protein n=1 Tax=Gordoniibacillus kamchatkensis TaxID=1590651 RepID=UPI0022B19B85|nr:histidine phosphatase family protein [Paenibacillus sp. VKM B-2647]
MARWLDFYEHVILRQHAGRQLLVVSHGAFIGRVLQFKGLEQAHDPLVNGSLTVLRHSGERWETVVYNDVGHLQL